MKEAERVGVIRTGSHAEAFELVSSAAELRYEEAQAQLAAYYRDGIGTGKDVRKAVFMVNRQCASGNALASLRTQTTQ